MGNRFIAELAAIHDRMEIVESFHSYGLAQCDMCEQPADYTVSAGDIDYHLHRGFTSVCEDHADEVIYDFCVSILQRKIDAGEMEVVTQRRLSI